MASFRMFMLRTCSMHLCFSESSKNSSSGQDQFMGIPGRVLRAKGIHRQAPGQSSFCPKPPAFHEWTHLGLTSGSPTLT